MPASMGRELAALAPNLIELYELSGADHNTVVVMARDLLLKAMQE